MELADMPTSPKNHNKIQLTHKHNDKATITPRFKPHNKLSDSTDVTKNVLII
jgi:hypothetical protein